MSRHEPFDLTSLDDLRRHLGRLGLALPIAEDTSVLGAPLRVGPFELPNRLAVHPMEGFDSGPDGGPSDLTHRRYRRFAQGGAGLIWFEATAVLPEARSNPRQLCLDSRSVRGFEDLLNTTLEAAQEAGRPRPVTVLQLTHSGRYCRPDGTPRPLPAQRSPALDPGLGISAESDLVSDAHLDDLQGAFGRAAQLAFQVGFDGVDLKSCHGYLISELLGAHTRPGRYGGTFENRTRFLLETLDLARGRAGGRFVTARLNAFDGIDYPWGWGVSAGNPAGPDLAEPVRLARELARRAVPLLSISVGNPNYNPHLLRPYDQPLAGTRAPDEHPLEGIARFAAITRTIQQAVPTLPVLTAGLGWLRHYMPYVAAGLVAEGWAALVGQGRGAIAYPESPADILAYGRMNPSACCIACSRCTELMRPDRLVGCVIRDAEVYAAEYQAARAARV